MSQMEGFFEEEFDGEAARFNRALARFKSRIDELEEEVERLRDEVAYLEQQSSDLRSTEYDEMSKAERVATLRTALARRAMRNGGKGAMTYDQVLALFDEHPSAGYAYKLMRLAAGYDTETGESEYPGFAYEEREEWSNRVTVDLATVKDRDVLSRVNKGNGDGGG